MSATSVTGVTTRRRTYRLNYLTGLIGAVIGYLVFYGFVERFIANGDPSFDDQALVIGWIGLFLGWLIGIGALKYPLSWALGLRDPDHEEELKLAGAGSGVARYFRFTTDHKVVGTQYLVLTMIMLGLGGIGAMLIRADLMFPGSRLFNPQAYNTIVTMHGMLMIATLITVWIGPFGNFIVPIMIGARDMAFPRLNALSFALLVPAVVIFLFIPFVGGIQTGWTIYAPLADQTGMGADAFTASMIIAGASSMLGAVNIIATVITMRAPGMRWTRLPMFVWGVIAAAILAAAGTSSFTADLFLILMDRLYGTSFFLSTSPSGTANQGGGNAWLAQNLFWFFGHPEVYLIVLPAFGAVLEMLPVFARKPLFGYKTAVLGLMGVVVLSFLVWSHHEFVSGWAQELRGYYMATTEAISIPTGLVFLAAIGTLWRGRIWITIPMAWCLAFIFCFLIGGLSGVYLSDVPADVQLHGSFFVTAHFHYTIFGGSLMAFFGAVYYWFPKMTGRYMNERLGWINFWGVFLAFNGAFLAMFWVGIEGMPRRIADYSPIFAQTNFIISIFAFLIGIFVAVFFYNLVFSWFAGEKAVANPWGSKTLEWQVPTPVPLENFEEIPVVTSAPYNYGERGQEPPPGAGREAPVPTPAGS